MRFPYLRLSPQDFAPIIPVKLEGVNGWLEFEAYIDSGASFSIFHADRAELLGIDYKKGTTVYPVVGDGGLLEVYLHNVSVILADEKFSAVIGFSKHLGSGFNLLGRKSFFDLFRICFDDINHIVDLNRIKKFSR